MPADALGLRLVEPAEVGVAASLFHAQLREHDLGGSVEELRTVIHSVISDPALGFILLAWADATAVGAAFAAAHTSLEHGGTIGWLEELYVTPAFRSRGIGSRLLAEVISRARQLEWRGIELEVVAGHERASALYVRHGFQSLSRKRFVRMLPS
jgi:GNAT superfamily N-acetyltransferase